VEATAETTEEEAVHTDPIAVVLQEHHLHPIRTEERHRPIQIEERHQMDMEEAILMAIEVVEIHLLMVEEVDMVARAEAVDTVF
jgi:hypothetical protein